MYVVSLRSNEEGAGYNPEYITSNGEEEDGTLCRRPDLMLGGSSGRGPPAGGGRAQILDRLLRLGPAADYGVSVALSSVCVVKVHTQSLLSSPGAAVVFFPCRLYERLMAMEPTYDKKVKRTMDEGLGFGLKLNKVDDVQLLSVVFVKG